MVARGDIVLVSLAGDYSKTRPGLVVQSDTTLAITGSVTFCLITSQLIGNSSLRVDVDPLPTTGLKVPSQIQTDKLFTLPSAKLKGPIGRIGSDVMARIELALALHLDLIAP